MFDKSDIKQWLERKGYYASDDNEMNIEMIEQCFNDLSDQWVSVEADYDLRDGVLYWVFFPDGTIEECRFNNYKNHGGQRDFWQKLNGDDVFMNSTKYIEIKKPEPPK